MSRDEPWAEYDRRIVVGATVQVHDVSGPTPGVAMGMLGSARGLRTAARAGQPLIGLVRSLEELPAYHCEHGTVWAEVLVARWQPRTDDDTAWCAWPVGWPARDLVFLDADGAAYRADVRRCQQSVLRQEVRRGLRALCQLLRPRQW